MSELSTNVQPDAVDCTAKADTLATGILFMLGVTVVQRLIGFIRSILFCGLLADGELGRWSLAFSFLLLVAPLSVLGLPGSFGRYVEHYRQRGQLRAFLRRTVIASSVLGTVGVAMVIGLADLWAWLVFGDETLAPLIRLTAVTLAVVIVSNFLIELLTAMRQVRAVAVMQFVSSLMFAILAVGLLYFTALREKAVIIAYGVSLLVAMGIAIVPLRQVGREATQGSVVLSHSKLWEKLVPFAAWIWVTNILANLFEATDRFMIVHLSAAGTSVSDSLVGQYHASRVVPYLLVGVSTMVAAIVLPHMSHDWESGNRRAVSHQHALTLKVGSLVLLAAGTLILLGAPILFTWLLSGKYDEGMSVLPMTLTYCVWFSLTTIAQNYLWCAERARLGSFGLMAGLIVNVACNALLFPILGLPGAVLATAIANAAALTVVMFFSSRLGFSVDRNIVLCCAFPAMLMFGPLPAVATLLVIIYLVVEKKWLFDQTERQELLSVLDDYRAKVLRWRAARQAAVST